MEIYGILEDMTRIKRFTLRSLHLKNFPGYSEHSENKNYVQNFKVKLRKTILWSRHKKLRWVLCMGCWTDHTQLCVRTQEITTNCCRLHKKSCTIPGEICYGFHSPNIDQVTTCLFFWYKSAEQAKCRSVRHNNTLKWWTPAKRANTISRHWLSNCNPIIHWAEMPVKILHTAPCSKSVVSHVPYNHFNLRLCFKDRKVSRLSGSVLKSMEQPWLMSAEDPANEDREVFWLTFTWGAALRTGLLLFNDNGYAYSATTI